MDLSKLSDSAFGLSLTWLTVLATVVFVEAFAPIRFEVFFGLTVVALIAGYMAGMARHLGLSESEAPPPLPPGLRAGDRYTSNPGR